MKVFMGVVFSFYLFSFVMLIWQGSSAQFRDVFGNLCATISIMFIGLLMWRGLMLP